MSSRSTTIVAFDWHCNHISSVYVSGTCDLYVCIAACRIVGIVVGGRVRHVVDVIKLGTADSSVNTRTGISIIHHVV